MTSATAYIRQMKKSVAILWAIIGFTASIVMGTLTVAGIYWAMTGQIAAAQTKADEALEAAKTVKAEAEKRSTDNRAEAEKQFSEIKTELSVIRSDIKQLLQRK